MGFKEIEPLHRMIEWALGLKGLYQVIEPIAVFTVCFNHQAYLGILNRVVSHDVNSNSLMQ
jgi:hypothetical protein